MKNQERNNTSPTPKASLLLMEDDLCKRELEISRNSSVGISSRIFYYYHHLDDGVPFKWEMQPGTPINPPPEEMVRPITPPPAHLSLGFPKPSIGESNKHCLFPANFKLFRLKNLRKRCFSRWSSLSMLTRGYNNSHDGESNSCGELERLETSKDYRSSSSSSSTSSSSSSSKDQRLIKASPRQWFRGCPPRNLKNIQSGFR